MTKGFFRERKHYSLQEITDNLISINMEETRRIVGILKKYGVVKAVKKNRPDFDDLSNEDIVLTDVIDSSSDIEYIFDYVGVVVIEGQVFKCYPKYIKSTEHLFENLKQVLKVIKKYNASEQSMTDGQAQGQCPQQDHGRKGDGRPCQGGEITFALHALLWAQEASSHCRLRHPITGPKPIRLPPEQRSLPARHPERTSVSGGDDA